MLKIFILEDDNDRIMFFKWYFQDSTFELFIATNAFEAKDVFEKNAPFDILFLDHDLGGLTYVSSEEKNTGYQFAKFLKNKDLSKSNIVIHSVNYKGALNMLSLLPTATYIPFTTLTNMLIKKEIKFE